jgi:hypothetical protein
MRRRDAGRMQAPNEDLAEHDRLGEDLRRHDDRTSLFMRI